MKIVLIVLILGISVLLLFTMVRSITRKRKPGLMAYEAFSKAISNKGSFRVIEFRESTDIAFSQQGVLWGIVIPKRETRLNEFYSYSSSGHICTYFSRKTKQDMKNLLGTIQQPETI